MPKSDDWTDEEIQACVDAFVDMYRREKRSEAFVKSHIVQQLLAGPLRDRTKGAVEMRFMNISHVLEAAFGSPFLRGYRPAKNVGPTNFQRIEAYLRPRLANIDLVMPTFDADELEKKTQELQALRHENKLTTKPRGNSVPRSKKGERQIFERDPNIRAFVLNRAGGVCEGCKEAAPFIGTNGPFLEVHHIMTLAEGGPDTIENTVALCPNCHRRAHLSVDAHSFREQLKEALAGL